MTLDAKDVNSFTSQKESKSLRFPHIRTLYFREGDILREEVENM